MVCKINFKNEDFNFDLIEYYFKNKNHSDELQKITDRIMNDISFNELFMFIDRTHSKIGQQYHYNQLSSIRSIINFEKQEKRIEYFSKNESVRNKVQSLLSKLNTKNDYFISNLFIDKFIQKPKWFWVIKILSLVAFCTLFFTLYLNSVFIFLLLIIFLVNTLIHIWNKNNILVYMDSIPRLPLFCKITTELIKLDIINPTTKDSVLYSVKSVEKLKNKIRFFKFETGFKSDIESGVFFVWEIVKTLFLIEPLVIFDVLKELEKKKNDVQTVFEYFGEIDSTISIAIIRNEQPCFCKPIITNSAGSLEFLDMYHPLIPDCISNSMKINGRSILLTGSNMSGKTTFVKTVFINLLLAQTINTSFSKYFKFSKSRLFSSINISDDLFNGKSYYFEEVLIIKDIIKESQSNSNNVFFLDEIFKGTNTIERIAAGKAILSYLSKLKNNIVFVSTHDIELADLLADAYDLYHFTETVQDGQIYFDYKIRSGNLSTKNAIRILEINDYPKEVLDEAINISNALLRNNS